MMPQQYCLRWKYHHSNLQNMFSQLLDRGCFCDVTLACEGQTLKAHRVVLCACSTFFDTILTNCSIEKDPIIIMKDCKFEDVKSLIEFMYKGEINVEHNNLASLLKTAEELRIKGLAEVSWRDEDTSDDQQKSGIKITNNNNNAYIERTTSHNNSSTDTNSQSIPLYLPNTSPVHNENGVQQIPSQKRKRGRPPLDGPFDSYSTPKIAHIESNASNFNSANLVSVMLDAENSMEKTNEDETCNESTTDMDCERELASPRVIPKIERPDTPTDDYNYYRGDTDVDGNCHDDMDYDDFKPPDMDASTSTTLTPQEQEEWKEVVKLNDYLLKGRRPQFWEESITKRVIEAIKTRDLEMKKAAELLGVSYGTLYGRYRETYGCLKHPYRIKEADIIGMLRRGNIAMPQAAELLKTSSANLIGLIE
ncbi:Protein tramtrack, alpha isoform, partial [Pseudolycoriella hygida]